MNALLANPIPNSKAEGVILAGILVILILMFTGSWFIEPNFY